MKIYYIFIRKWQSTNENKRQNWQDKYWQGCIDLNSHMKEKWYSSSRKLFLYTVKHMLTMLPRNSILRYLPNRIKNVYSYKNIYMIKSNLMCIAFLFISNKNLK